MSLPNPAMTFTPFDPLTAAQLNDFVENNEALAAGNGFNTGAIATAKILDGNVTPAKLADEVRWWEELGRTTLTPAGDTITLNGLTAKKSLLIYISLQATGGTIIPALRFNNDSAANYASRAQSNGAADATSTSTTSININVNSLTTPQFTVLEVKNALANEKLVRGFSHDPGVAGAGNIPNRREMASKWVNTSAQITRVDVINSGTGDFAIGSQIVVYGHD